MEELLRLEERNVIFESTPICIAGSEIWASWEDVRPPISARSGIYSSLIRGGITAWHLWLRNVCPALSKLDRKRFCGLAFLLAGTTFFLPSNGLFGCLAFLLLGTAYVALLYGRLINAGFAVKWSALPTCIFLLAIFSVMMARVTAVPAIGTMIAFPALGILFFMGMPACVLPPGFVQIRKFDRAAWILSALCAVIAIMNLTTFSNLGSQGAFRTSNNIHAIRAIEALDRTHAAFVGCTAYEFQRINQALDNGAFAASALNDLQRRQGDYGDEPRVLGDAVRTFAEEFAGLPNATEVMKTDVITYATSCAIAMSYLSGSGDFIKFSNACIDERDLYEKLRNTLSGGL
ncbi:MAG: hypothetical protein ACREKL_12040 [Chthoniobacterales bacterium]